MGLLYEIASYIYWKSSFKYYCEQRTYASIQHNIHKNLKKKEPFLRYNSVLFSKPSH